MNTHRRLALALAALAGLAGAWALSGTDASRAETVPPDLRPNIVVVMSDDQTASSLGVMPNVRRLLVRQGTTFTSSFATWPLCCPSRATFLTGQYAHNHGVLGNTPPRGGYDRLDHTNTLPIWLQDAGYHTALVGKYLNGYASPGREREIPAGWSEWHGTARGGFFGQTLNVNGALLRFGTRPEHYSTDVLAGRAVDVVRRRAPLSEPFFLWLTPHAPHSGGPRDPDDPLPPPVPGERLPDNPTTSPAPRHRDLFASRLLPMPPSFNESDVTDKPVHVRTTRPLGNEQIAVLREAYQQRLESLLAIDDAVGAVVAALAAAGELERTLFVYTSDNGFMQGEHRLAKGKNVVYEPSIRVPLVLRGPGVPARQRIPRLVGNIDLAPTLLEAAEASAGLGLDGSSLLALAKQPTMPWRDALLIERTAPVSAQNPPFTAIRTSRYVYAEYANGERELYDLLEDPGQLRSRHADPAYGSIRGRLATRLSGLRRCAGASCSDARLEVGAGTRTR